MPVAPSDVTRRRMQRQRGRDTQPELKIRRILYANELRYRVDYRFTGSRQRVDIAFVGKRVAVFVDGCFWHSCPIHGTLPKANSEWWQAKLAANERRDRRADADLARQGWKVLRIWEHESADRAAGRIMRALGQAP